MSALIARSRAAVVARSICRPLHQVAGTQPRAQVIKNFAPVLPALRFGPSFATPAALVRILQFLRRRSVDGARPYTANEGEHVERPFLCDLRPQALSRA